MREFLRGECNAWRAITPIRHPLNWNSLQGNTPPFTLQGFRSSPTRGASDGLPTAYQGENRQKAEALYQVQCSGELPIPLQEMPQGSELTP